MNDIDARPRPAVADLIRWGPTIAGVLIATAVFTTANAGWFAAAYSSADNVWRDALPWLVGGTAAVSLFLAGLFAGLFSGIRGMGAGLVNGATAWGLFFLVSMAAVLPGALNLNAQLRDSFVAIGQDGAGGASRGLWTGFWALLMGAVLALLGGAVGGAVHRRVNVARVQRDTATHGDGTGLGTTVHEGEGPYRAIGDGPETRVDGGVPRPAPAPAAGERTAVIDRR